MIGPLDPDSLDPAVLREGAELLERIALRKRQQAEIIELSVITGALTTPDAAGVRGIDRMIQLDPFRALEVFKTIYARITMLALQVARS
jgi:hypothetical protein